MTCLWRLEHYILGLDVLLGLGFGGGSVDDGHLAHFDGGPLALRRRLLT
jgi:hypothetical protein